MLWFHQPWYVRMIVCHSATLVAVQRPQPCTFSASCGSVKGKYDDREADYSFRLRFVSLRLYPPFLGWYI